MKSMRDAFGQTLVDLAKIRDDFVVLDADVAGGTGVAPFRDLFPKRFIQCGIAEQNMVSAAAGLSTTGIIPVVTCYAVFAAMRALDQCRNSIAYPKFNVKIVASHLGLDVGPDGPTHQCLEDIAIFRSIPNFTIVSPASPQELAPAFEAILDMQGPVYFRTGRSPLPEIYSQPPDFQLGKGNILREGKDVSIIAVGVMVHRALEAAKALEAQNISCRVINMHTLKPLDEKLICESASHTGAIVTAEDGNILGGLGGAVAEVLSENIPVPLKRVGVQDCFAESGDPSDLAMKYDLMPDNIIKAVHETLKRKLMKQA